MQHKWYRFHALTHAWHYLWSEAFLCLLYALLVFVVPVGAIALRLQDRGLFMQSGLPSAVTSYTVSFGYSSPDPVGSVDMLFCESPIPYLPCVTPAGLDVSHATLSNQAGETGFAISSQSTNHVLLSRTPTTPITAGLSSYTLSDVTNPSDVTQAFSIRLQTHGTTNAIDPQIDYGSVRGQVTNAIVIQTQVPPMLIFCLAHQVDLGCTGTDDTYFTDMGELDPDDTSVATSQMAVGTNASQGFAITANGTPLAAATNIIQGLATPTASIKGVNQFGINLVANTDPAVGNDPEGDFTNAIAAPGYNQPNEYKYTSGDVVAYSPNVSLMRKFTVSYVVNADKDLRAGVYSTTITYIASGRF